jgi:chromosome segregation ATPase
MSNSLQGLVDTALSAAEDLSMDPVTKDYVDNRDELVESRAAAIAAEIKASVDASLARSYAHEKISEARDQAIERRFISIENRMDRVEKGMVTLRTTVIVTGISVVLGIAGLNAAIMQNMQAAFDSGRMVSASQAEVQRQIRETDASLKAIDMKLAKTDAKLVAIDLKLAKTDENLRETAVLLKEAKKLLPPPRRPGAR